MEFDPIIRCSRYYGWEATQSKPKGGIGASLKLCGRGRLARAEPTKGRETSFDRTRWKKPTAAAKAVIPGGDMRHG
jgi:hypothetical protein